MCLVVVFSHPPWTEKGPLVIHRVVIVKARYRASGEKRNKLIRIRHLHQNQRFAVN